MNLALKRCAVLVLAVSLAACAAGRAFSRGERASRAGDWDAAVEYYRQAMQNDPDKAEYKIALERATFAASALHTDRARKAEAEGRTEEALREYRRAAELDPSNRQAAMRAGEIERTLRERMEAAQPRPEIEKLREAARRAISAPELSPTAPLGPVRFGPNASLKDVLTLIGEMTGISVNFDRDYQDRTISINVEGQSLEQVLNMIMQSNQLFYKVIGPQAIVVVGDTAQKRQQYEEQVIQTFFVSHADATEMATLLTGMLRIGGMAIQPNFLANKTNNTITARGSASVVRIAERILQANDKPRAEVVIDVQILEVSRERAKRYGLSLTDYAIGGIFSPEVAPAGAPSTGTGTGTGGTTTTAGSGTAPTSVASPPPFNVNTITQGISTADFYAAVPAFIVRFLESDSQTKVLAKPQLRGTEGKKVSLNLGEEVPIPSTTFTPLATGGAAANPLTSFGYRPIGIIVEMTPRVTYEGDIILELVLENSARGQDANIAGQNLPSFTSRKVTTTLRLRDGESNLLAGLLREDERRALRGFPGLLRVPVLQQLFGDNDTNIRQTDIVMLLTPRIVRSHELRAADLSEIFIGTQMNPTLGGAPLLIQVPGADAAPPPPAPAPGTGKPQLQMPPGSSPIPGFTTNPPAPPAAPVAPPVAPPPPDPVPPAPPPAAPTTPVQPPATPVMPPPATPPDVPPATTTASPAGTNPPAAATSGGGGRITLAPQPEMRVGGGPYAVPVSIGGASRISTLSLTLTYNPAVLRVRNVQEGSFMRQAGVNVTFVPQTDATAGRVDLVLTRVNDAIGASGTGLVAAVMFDAIAPGTSPLTITGVGTVVGGGAATLTFAPANVVVK